MMNERILTIVRRAVDHPNAVPIEKVTIRKKKRKSMFPVPRKG